VADTVLEYGKTKITGNKLTRRVSYASFQAYLSCNFVQPIKICFLRHCIACSFYFFCPPIDIDQIKEKMVGLHHMWTFVLWFVLLGTGTEQALSFVVLACFVWTYSLHISELWVKMVSYSIDTYARILLMKRLD